MDLFTGWESLDDVVSLSCREIAWSAGDTLMQGLHFSFVNFGYPPWRDCLSNFLEVQIR